MKIYTAYASCDGWEPIFVCFSQDEAEDEIRRAVAQWGEKQDYDVNADLPLDVMIEKFDAQANARQNDEFRHEIKMHDISSHPAILAAKAALIAARDKGQDQALMHQIDAALLLLQK